MCSNKKWRRESEREQDGGWEEKNDNPQGLLDFLTPYSSLPVLFSPLLYPVLSRDFQWEMLEIKDFNFSLVSVI